VLTDIDGKDVVVSSGKMGYIYVTDAKSGDLIWKQSVGKHNGHDTDGQKQLDGTLAPLKAPLTVYPGPYGGTETNMAVEDDVIYAAVVDLPGEAKTTKDLSSPVLPVDFAKGKGQIMALNMKDGSTKWKVDYPTLPLGAMTVSNDLVFTTTLDGKVHAYTKEDGKEVWSDDMKVGTNSPLAIAGDYLFTAAAFPQGKGQKSMFYVYKIGATETTPPVSKNADSTGSSAEGDDADDTAAQSPEAAEGGQSVDVTVKEGELKFSTDKLQAKAGKVTFTFTNPDSIAHDFQVKDKDGKNLGGTKLISNGDKDTVTIDLKAGDYEFYCTPHESAGMKGDLTVS
jgi:plastocyanin